MRPPAVRAVFSGSRAVEHLDRWRSRHASGWLRVEGVPPPLIQPASGVTARSVVLTVRRSECRVRDPARKAVAVEGAHTRVPRSRKAETHLQGGTGATGLRDLAVEGTGQPGGSRLQGSRLTVRRRCRLRDLGAAEILLAEEWALLGSNQ